MALVLLVAACAGIGQDDSDDTAVLGMAHVAAVLPSSTDGSDPVRAGDRPGRIGGESLSVVRVASSKPTSGGEDGPTERVVAEPDAEPDDATADPPEASDSEDKSKAIYLTFDDGPTVKYTKRILDLLDQYDAKATFFQVGEAATAHPELTRAVVARGHAVGNHTWNHKDLRKLSTGKVNREITRTSAALGKLTGRPITCLRPPFGAVNPRVRSAIRRKDLAMKLWDIDPRDWKRPGAAAIARRVVAHARPGAVSLMHDGGGNRSQSVSALKRILRSLSKKGYRFETLPGC